MPQHSPLLCLVAFCWSCGCLAADAQDSILLKGGNVVTMTETGIVTADVLVRDGKIAAIGGELDASDTRVIDISGMTVTPGWIDARSPLWLTTGAARDGAADGGLNVLDGIDIFDEDWQAAAGQGITAVYVQPAASGNLGGVGAVLRVADVENADDLVLRASAAVQASIGVSGNSRTSRERASQFDRIHKALEAAKKYGEEWEKYDKYQASLKNKKDDDAKADDKKDKSDEKDADEKGEKKESPPPKKETKEDADEDEKQPEKKESKDAADKKEDKSDEKPPKKPTRDPAKEQLLMAVRGEIPLRLEVHRQDEVRHALKLADTFQLKLILDGVTRPGDALEALRKERIPLVLGPAILRKADAATLGPEASLETLTSHQPRWALGSFSEVGRGTRMLRARAARAVSLGVDRHEVLAAVTSDAAALLGVDDQCGVIAKEYRADLAVFAGDPLDPSIPVRMTLSGGQITHEADVTLRTGPEGTVSPTPVSLPPRYAMRSLRVLGSDGKLGPATILVSDGRISSISDQETTEGLPHFDLGNAVVTPGLFVAHSTHGTAAAADTTEAAIPEAEAATAWHLTKEQTEFWTREGVLRMAVTPSNRNVIAGRVSLARLGAGEPILQRDVAVQFVLTDSARITERYPASLAGQAELTRSWLEGQAVSTSLFLPAVLQDRLLEERRQVLQAVKSGQTPAWFAAETRAEIRVAAGCGRDLDVRTVLLQPEELEQLAAGDIPGVHGIIVRPIAERDYDRYVSMLVQIGARSIPLAFAAEDAGSLRRTAALAVAAGWSPEAALLALTHGGIDAVGIQNEQSRLANNSPADFVVWNDHPLDLQSRPVLVVVAGRVLHSEP